MEKAAIFMTGKTISHFRQETQRTASALLRAFRDGVERFAKGLLQRQRLRRRRVFFPNRVGLGRRRSRCQAKIGGMVPLWPLGTLWLAYFAARAVASDDAPLKCEDLRIGQYPEAGRMPREPGGDGLCGWRGVREEGGGDGAL